MTAALPLISVISAAVSSASAVKSMMSKPKSATSGVSMSAEEQAKTTAEEQERARKLALQQRGRAATRLSGESVYDTTATGGLATKKLLG